MNLTFPSSSISGAPLATVGILAPLVGSVLADLVCRLSGRASAASRHLIWTLAFAMMAVCVPVTLLPIRVAVPILPAGSGQRILSAVSRPLEMGISNSAADPPVVGDHPTPASPTLAFWLRNQPWQGVFLSLWLTGLLVLTFTTLAGTFRLRGIIRRSRPVEDQIPVWTELLSLAGLGQSVRLFGSDEVRIPLVTGLWRATVIFPEAALLWPAQTLRAALVHELAHIARKDLLWSAFARLVASLYWFNPAAWFGLRSLQAQAEMAADDDVVVTELHPVAYAESLLMLVRNLRETDGSLFPAMGMLEGPGIEARVERILDAGRPRLAPRRSVRVTALLCGTLATAAVMVVRPVAALAPPMPLGLRAAHVSVSQAANVEPNSGSTTEGAPGEMPAITDLGTQLPGTHWKATPANPLRGGLYPVLNFNENTVEPAGYRYEINRHDSTVRIFFNHGDTQLMLLTNDGKRLRFTFGSKDYVYELAAD